MKRLAEFIFAPIDVLLSRIVSAAGALVMVQFPNFTVHYLQRLGGHIDELKRILEQYSQAAAMTGKTLEEYVLLHKSSNVPEIVQTGKIIESSAERYIQLKLSLDQISQSPSVMKFFYFLKNADYEIFKSTLGNYTPGFSFSAECFVYAAIGIVFSSIAYFMIKYAAKSLFRRLMKKRNA